MQKSLCPQCFFLGPESQVRSNKYSTLEAAIEDAYHCAEDLGKPIRIFVLWNDNTQDKVAEVPANPGREYKACASNRTSKKA